ncbi:hypothetical protein GCM10027277_14070 [Pseudoduganella ginsengisoli]|uniref:Uncharacterized protein n=1 Tax=Pseudoduganella ginsengisoli TaxID=1462440 RepID=A0A6L6PVT3_9BURK|nr:hypothetical protein [Pseudoduganella ginsengisoli]MTW01331.1 hypothetical protein [Pseudoduganella ginsengisoli]
MAIIKKIPTVSNRVPAVAAMAAGSVIILCAAATAAILGWMPAHQAHSDEALPPVSAAPEAVDGALRKVSLPATPAVKQRTPRALQTASAT